MRVFHVFEDRVQQLLSVHQQVPITVRGRTLRIERAENRPYDLSSSPGSSRHPLELGKPPDLAISSTTLKELTRTVPRFRGSHEPSRILWIDLLPTNISRTALKFLEPNGCIVDIRSCT
jgi:hypothetical protein